MKRKAMAVLMLLIEYFAFVNVCPPLFITYIQPPESIATSADVDKVEVIYNNNP
jgi:hypothetical protein